MMDVLYYYFVIGIFKFVVGQPANETGIPTGSSVATSPEVVWLAGPSQNGSVSILSDTATSSTTGSLEPVITISTRTTSTTATSTSTSTIPSTTPLPTTATISPVIRYQDFGDCNCDLKVDGCDINCCCDADCDLSERSTFSLDCIAQTRLDYSQSESCFAETILMRNSSSLPSYRHPSGSVCLIYDNNPQRLFYREPSPLNSLSEFDAPWLARSVLGAIFPPRMLNTDIMEILNRNPKVPTFKIGDPIFFISNSDRIVQRLQFPSHGSLSTRCSAPENLNFLNSTDSWCSYGTDNLETDCATNSFFKIATFTDHRVVGSAQAFAAANVTSGSVNDFSALLESDLGQHTVPVQVNGIFALRSVGEEFQAVNIPDLGTFPSPTFSPDGRTCMNAVTDIHYIVTFNGSRIEAVNVTIFLTPISQVNGTFKQRFHLSFLSAISTGSGDVVRSGNPGYLDGSNVLVATVFNPTSLPVSDQPAEDLSLPGLDSEGRCRNTDTTGVLFGENMQLSCTVLIDIENPTAACQNLQNQIMSAMTNGRDLPTNVSIYGNGTTFKSTGWIPVLRQITSDDMSFVPPKLCRNIVLGVSIEITYSKVGFLINPQSRITGLLYRFMDPIDIVLECPYYGCRNGSLLPVEILMSVSFSVFSMAAVDLRSLQPPVSRFLPAGFFSPY